MAVAPADLTAPKGAVQPSFFPDDDAAALAARLQLWITEGTERAEDIADIDAHDRAVAAWAYYRAFRAVYLRKSDEPSTVELRDQGSRQNLITQIQNFRDEAEAYRAEFEALLAAAAQDAGTVPSAPPVPATTSVPITFVW